MLSLKYLCDIHVEILSYWIIWTICIFWKLSPCCLYHLQIFFSQSIGCSFILFAVFFTVWKLLGLIRSHLFIFALICTALGDCPKKISLWFSSENVSPVFSPRGFMALCLTSSYFEFIVVCGVRECSDSDSHAAVQLSQHLLKRLSFPQCISCLCWRLIDHRYADLFLGSLLCCINSYVWFWPSQAVLISIAL